MANKKPRIDSTEWRNQNPARAREMITGINEETKKPKFTEAMAEWAKNNPNRSTDAAKTRRTVKSAEVTKVPRVRTKAQKEERSKEVQAWLATRPEGGSRAEYVAWAAKNPNRVSNAGRVGAAQTNAAKAAKKPAKKAATKKAAPKKKAK